jgi:F-type H+-transporting ATPase subunit epsilon
MSLRLKVLIPSEIVIDEKVTKVVAEAENGYFCLLPRHIDFVSVLVPGLLSFTIPTGQEEFMAIDEGILVKRGDEVLVSTKNAVLGPDLGTLKHTIEKQFRVLDDHEKLARGALAKLEADLIRRFMEFEQPGYG